jgi:hypothetical protein
LVAENITFSSHKQKKPLISERLLVKGVKSYLMLILR